MTGITPSALVDANILVYLSNSASEFHSSSRFSLETMRERGTEVFVAPQTEVEFWAVATRPATANGLALSPYQTEERMIQFRRAFVFLPEIIGVQNRWREIVRRYEVSGRQVHDAQLIAAMDVYGIRIIVTKNTKDFHRYSWIEAVDPSDYVSKR